MAVRTCITLCPSLVVHPADMKGDGPSNCIDLKGLDKGWPGDAIFSPSPPLERQTPALASFRHGLTRWRNC